MTDEEAEKNGCEAFPLTDDEETAIKSGSATLKSIRSALREQLRRHKLSMDCPKTSKEIHRHYAGLRIYRL